MCNSACIEFGVTHLRSEDVRDRAVLEVGARDVNGGLRSLVESLGPASYLGVDICSGPGVDEVCPAEHLVQRYGSNAFDIVLSTEMLEHVRDWRLAVSNLKQVLRPAGILLFTTRSQGYPLHGYPSDFWRYETEDVLAIFADFSVQALLKDPSEPGVFFLGRKPLAGFVEVGLSNYSLYSMITRRRTPEVRDLEFLLFRTATAAGRLLPSPVRRIVRNVLRV